MDNTTLNGNVIHWSLEQGTEEWATLHRGRLTASHASKLLTPTGRISAQRNAILAQVVAEVAGFEDTETTPFTSDWMQRGIDLEAEARDWYSFASGLDIRQAGFIEGMYIGCSPDGIIVGCGTNHLWDARDAAFLIPLEIKCPKPSTHIKWFIENELPPEHKAQVHMQMVMLDSPSAHFISYHPQMEPLIVIVERDDFTTALEVALDNFRNDVEVALKKIMDVGDD